MHQRVGYPEELLYEWRLKYYFLILTVETGATVGGQIGVYSNK